MVQGQAHCASNKHGAFFDEGDFWLGSALLELQRIVVRKDEEKQQIVEQLGMYGCRF